MHPTAYMPFYGSDFFGALEGYDSTIVAAYLRALWHYWHHCHCEGLPNDPPYLRGICHADPATWPTVSPIIFGKLFTLDPRCNLWQQKRAQHEYAKSVARYKRRSESGRTGARARWGQRAPDGTDTAQHGNPEGMRKHRRTQCVRNGNQNQTQNQIQNNTQTQIQRQNQKQLNDELPLPSPRTNTERSSSYRFESDLMAQLTELLGEDEMARAGGHWRKNWVRKHPGLLERALADLRLQLRERGEDFALCRGAWLTDLLKRWLTAPTTFPKPAGTQPPGPLPAGEGNN